MVDVVNILLINTGVSLIVLFVLLLLLTNKPASKKEERVYLSRDMNKIKEQVVDSTEEI